MGKSIFQLLGPLLAVAFVVAACGDDGPDSSSPQPSPTNIAAQAPTPNPCGEGNREFDHPALAAEGPVCIPEDPSRIAVFDANMTSFMVQQGIKSVAHMDIWIASLRDSLPDELERIDATVAGSQSVGGPREVNLEVLAGTKPDIILTAEHYLTGVEDQVAAIAPVVAFYYRSGKGGSPAEWEAILSLYGSALNIEGAVDAAVAGVNKRIEDLAALLVGRQGETVSVVLMGAQLRVLKVGWAFHRILEAAGFARPQGQDAAAAEVDDALQAPISTEQLPSVDADHLFLVVFDTGDSLSDANKTLVEEIQASPLYRSLKVVQNGNAHVVRGYWASGGIYDLHQTLDDMFLHIAGVNPAEASPNPLSR